MAELVVEFWPKLSVQLFYYFVQVYSPASCLHGETAYRIERLLSLGAQIFRSAVISLQAVILHKHAWSHTSLHAGAWACIQFPRLTWSYMSLHAVSWSCMPLHELYAVPLFVWAAHKNFAVLVALSWALSLKLSPEPSLDLSPEPSLDLSPEPFLEPSLELSPKSSLKLACLPAFLLAYLLVL